MNWKSFLLTLVTWVSLFSFSCKKDATISGPISQCLSWTKVFNSNDYSLDFTILNWCQWDDTCFVDIAQWNLSFSWYVPIDSNIVNFQVVWFDNGANVHLTDMSGATIPSN